MRTLKNLRNKIVCLEQQYQQTRASRILHLQLTQLHLPIEMGHNRMHMMCLVVLHACVFVCALCILIWTWNRIGYRMTTMLFRSFNRTSGWLMLLLDTPNFSPLPNFEYWPISYRWRHNIMYSDEHYLPQWTKISTPARKNIMRAQSNITFLTVDWIWIISVPWRTVSNER